MEKRLFRRPLPLVSDIEAVFNIDFYRGVFTFKARDRSRFLSERVWLSWNARFAGTEAGNIDNRGYRHIRVNGLRYMAHRLLWKCAGFGEPDELDHIDCNAGNNSVQNLRPATRSENNRNRALSKYNTTGFCGVYESARGRWVSQIKIHGHPYHLGLFDTIDEAIAARAGAEKMLQILTKPEPVDMVRLYSGKAMQRARAKEAQEGRK